MDPSSPMANALGISSSAPLPPSCAEDVGMLGVHQQLPASVPAAGQQAALHCHTEPEVPTQSPCSKRPLPPLQQAQAYAAKPPAADNTAQEQKSAGMTFSLKDLERCQRENQKLFEYRARVRAEAQDWAASNPTWHRDLYVGPPRFMGSGLHPAQAQTSNVGELKRRAPVALLPSRDCTAEPSADDSAAQEHKAWTFSLKDLKRCQRWNQELVERRVRLEPEDYIQDGAFYYNPDPPWERDMYTGSPRFMGLGMQPGEAQDGNVGELKKEALAALLPLRDSTAKPSADDSAAQEHKVATLSPCSKRPRVLPAVASSGQPQNSRSVGLRMTTRAALVPTASAAADNAAQEQKAGVQS